LESRLQDMLTLITVITLGAPALARAVLPNVAIASGWSFGAALIYLLAMGIGIWGRAQGELRTIDPKALFDEWMDLPPETFQIEALRYAGEHLRENDLTVRRRHFALLVMSGLFAVETVLLFLWLVA
jgi:hypothetical protein